MTEPVAPVAPEGYTFVTGDLTNPIWDDVGAWQEWQWGTYETDLPRVVFVHAECGAFVAGAMTATHDAWHASLPSA